MIDRMWKKLLFLHKNKMCFVQTIIYRPSARRIVAVSSVAFGKEIQAYSLKTRPNNEKICIAFLLIS
jgi:hypothetical protein